MDSMDLEKARQLIEEQQQKLADQCSREIEEILKKYNFQIQATPSQVILVPQNIRG